MTEEQGHSNKKEREKKVMQQDESQNMMRLKPKCYKNKVVRL